ncbi:hypothetical protein MERGE_002473 [Pneumocystis wakefieldiae]|uniref:CDP-diacylglycerol--glycerol-3-phosphate 3-phosphatidyltransferase n=1 Tax=Pneumocystis wakefieldiae TaxID=38082 RepID=A0A899G1D3_9ASCO|nr:hypothetical protein MERGE_002473 [Pneumocystis wakefieldiae]
MLLKGFISRELIPGAQNELKGSLQRISDHALDDLLLGLSQFAPSFVLNKEKITVLTEPKEFFFTLKNKILNARRRVFLSTLYIGKSEYELYTVLHKALSLNMDLRVSILMDALRGTREAPGPTSASLLVPLISLFGRHRVDICMYHTPNSSGLKRILPSRVNECWGVQHMKIYGFDDEVILSGANLSCEYFTNRQDRYHLFSSPQLTDFYATIHQFISSISYKLVPSDSPEKMALVWLSDTNCPEPTKDPENFRRHSTSVLLKLLKPTPINTNEVFSTIVYPLFQFSPIFKPYDFSTEKKGICLILDTFLSSQSTDYDWILTSGYFNTDKDYSKRLLTSSSKGCVIVSSQQANSFYNSPWPSKMIPSAYSFLAERFLLDVYKANKQDNIHLEEWKNGCHGEGGWTYHAKGLWIMPSQENEDKGRKPYITFIGSSNFSRRSHSLDLEATALIITFDTELKKSLRDEIENFRNYSKKVDLSDFSSPDRKTGWFVKLCVWILGKMF